MKYSTKMLVVPYSNNFNQTPEEKYTSELDQKMSVILKNSKLSPEDKLKQYNHVLDLYLNKKKEELKVISQPTDQIKDSNEQLLNTILTKLSEFSKKEIKQEPVSVKEESNIENFVKANKNNTLNLTVKQKNRNLLLDKMIENDNLGVNSNITTDDELLVKNLKPRKKYVRKLYNKQNTPRPLRNNTNPQDFEFKDKNNPRTGNGFNSGTWLTKTFF